MGQRQRNRETFTEGTVKKGKETERTKTVKTETEGIEKKIQRQRKVRRKRRQMGQRQRNRGKRRIKRRIRRQQGHCKSEQ